MSIVVVQLINLTVCTFLFLSFGAPCPVAHDYYTSEPEA
jgi:hypothetical protein